MSNLIMFANDYLINDNFELLRPLKTPIYFKLEIEQKMSL